MWLLFFTEESKIKAVVVLSRKYFERYTEKWFFSHHKKVTRKVRSSSICHFRKYCYVVKKGKYPSLSNNGIYIFTRFRHLSRRRNLKIVFGFYVNWLFGCTSSIHEQIWKEKVHRKKKKNIFFSEKLNCEVSRKCCFNS